MINRMAEIRAYNTRQGHILSGRALPSADELLRLMPFFEDSIRDDVLTWVKAAIARLERLDPPERRALPPISEAAQRLGRLECFWCEASPEH